jgi:pullulanase/glycogen debranching enzyme
MEREKIFFSASWTSIHTGVVSFKRDWNAKTLPNLKWGPDRLPLRDLEPAPLSDYGNLSGYFVRDDRLWFVVRKDRYVHIDFAAERLFLAGEFNGWGSAIGEEIWELKPETIDGVEFFALEIKPKQLDRRTAHRFKFVTGKGRWLEVPADAPNVATDEKGNRNFQLRPQRTGRHRFFFRTPLPLNQSPDPVLVYEGRRAVDEVRLRPGVFLKSLETKAPLGAMVESDQTVFRLFAPRASKVSLYLWEKLEETPNRAISMRFDPESLTWEAVVPGNRDGWFYMFGVDGDDQDGFCHFDANFRILDPYAKACVGPLGPGIVTAPTRFPKVKQPFSPPKWHDLVIMEVHLRDVLARSRVDLAEDERRGFTGLKKYLRGHGCYLRELGVNAIELQPVQEFDTKDPKDYGWGYMPVNYFSPASQYSLDPAKGSQVEEFRAVVEAFHEAGLAVIIDVVYNHVGEPNFLQYIDKEYYFLLNSDGEYMNYSGCGNTMDPDTPMSRRLMRDSMVHFLETYDVDGFRFDLGELLGLQCLGYLEDEVKKVKPSTFLVAEPWSFRGHIAGQFKDSIGVAFWHDGYREFIREYLVGKGSAEGLQYFMQGSRDNLTAFPAQTVNYVCSHDDRVWIDKITENAKFDGSYPTPNDRRRTHLMAATLLFSVGVPMLHGGVDFLYSKGGVNNTYLDGARNALPYERLRFFSGTHEYFRSLIALRLSPLGKLLRLDGHPERGYFRTAMQDRALAICYNAHRERGTRQLIFAINPTFSAIRLPFEGIDWSEWTQIMDHERVAPDGLASGYFTTKGEMVELPPLSCGAWTIF